MSAVLSVAASTTDWISAVGTAGAMIGALVLLAIEMSRHGAERREREAAQAHLVSAWCSLDTEDGWIYVVRNRSETPVYEVTVGIRGFDDTWRRVPLLTPGGDARIPFPIEVVPPPERSGHPPVEIRFRDAGHRWWSRDADGVLSRSERT